MIWILVTLHRLIRQERINIYRRLAELLFFLNYRDLRKRLVKERKDSKVIVKSILILLMNIVFNRIEKK